MPNITHKMGESIDLTGPIMNIECKTISIMTSKRVEICIKEGRILSAFIVQYFPYLGFSAGLETFFSQHLDIIISLFTNLIVKIFLIQYQLMKPLDNPLDLFAFNFMFIIPKIKAYLSSAPTFLCLYKKQSIAHFEGIKSSFV